MCAASVSVIQISGENAVHHYKSWGHAINYGMRIPHIALKSQLNDDKTRSRSIQLGCV